MYNELILISFFLFGVIMSIQDIRKRIVKNYLSYSFILISLIFYTISIFKYGFNLSSLFSLIISILISFLLFYKKIIGAADSKILIGISLYLLSLNNELYLFDFITNLIIIYVITILLLVIFKTKLKVKLNTIKTTPYELIIFQTLFTLSIVSLFARFIGLHYFDPLLTMFFIIILLFTLSPIAKRIYSSLDQNSQVVISFTLFSYAFYELFNFFLNSFLYLLTIKTLIHQIGELSNQINYNNSHTSFALVPVLVISAIIVITYKSNLVLIILAN